MTWRSFRALAVLALLARAVHAQQEPGSISGHVTSEAGAPVVGAHVSLLLLNLGATTGQGGSFRIAVPATRADGRTATVTVNVLGFKSKSVTVTLTSSAQRVDFVLAPQAIVLQQVVVTGEGILATQEQLGVTINGVDGDALVHSGESNLVNALSGKAPNVQIQSQSGDPGSSTSIQIRGLKSISGAGQPLFVVDGVPLDNQMNWFDWPAGDVVSPNRIADVNLNDIESVTILKGAAASAIYGARAAQGVVLITTKSGQPGATGYNLDLSYSANDVGRGFPLQRSFGQGDGVPGNPQGTCTTINCYASSSSWGPALPAGTKTYDHFHEIFETGSIWDAVLSMSGGNDKQTFYLSAGYTANQGFAVGPNDSYDRVTFRLKGSQMLGDRARLAANISYVSSSGSYIQRGQNGAWGLMFGSLSAPPEFNNFYYLDSVSGMHRSYSFPNPSATSDTLSRVFDNPIWSVHAQPASSALARFYGNVDLNWNPSEWLTIQWTPGMDYYTDARYYASPFTSAKATFGTVQRAVFQNLIVSSVLTIAARHTFSPDFAGTFTLGNELNSMNTVTLLAQGFNLIAPTPLVIANTSNQWSFDAQQIVRGQAYFGQVTGDFWDQLYLTVALRNDGFSTFSQNDPRAWYPKASAAWTFSKPLSPSSRGALQYGKLRIAYGETGKAPDAYSTLTTYVEPFPGIPGVTSSPQLGNDRLEPERQKELEGGFDLGFFNGMVGLSLTGYTSRANNVIIPLPLPASSGVFTQVQNAATIQNDGLEAQLNITSPASSRKVQWALGLLWGKNRNQVLGLAEGVTEIPIGVSFPLTALTRVGFPVGAIGGIDFSRCGNGPVLNDQADSVAKYCVGQPKGALYIGADGFPVFDDSVRILGSAQPDWAGSIRGSITVIRSLQFSFLVDIRHGSQVYNGTRSGLYTLGTHKDTEIRGTMQTFGSPDWHPGPVVGPGAGRPVLIDLNWFQGDGASFDRISADFAENGGFTKLREVAVQYTWFGAWVSRTLGLSSLVMRVAGRNLVTWTGYSGIDPETNITGAAILVQNVDFYNNPQARSLILSVGLNR